MTQTHQPANRWNYALLLNYLFPIGFLIWNPPFAAPAAGGILLLAALFTFFLLGRPRGEYWLTLGLLACILLLAFLWHPMCLYLSFLAADPLGRAPLKRLVPVSAAFAVLAAASAARAGWFAQPGLLVAMIPPVFAVAALPYIIRASARYKDMAIRLEAAQSQIERLAQEAERRRIAGELHDTLGHTLTFIALKAELAAKTAHKDPARAAAEMEEVRGTARAALKQMREIVAGMRYVRLADELEACRALFAAAGVGFAAEGDFGAPPVTALQETILAMGLREAATNVVRHSGAGRCSVSLREEEGRLLLTVEDDGVGLEARRAAAEAGGAAGAGAAGGAAAGAAGGAAAEAAGGAAAGTGRAAMKERLRLVEGELIEARSPLGGASVRMVVPIVLREGEGHFRQ